MDSVAHELHTILSDVHLLQAVEAGRVNLVRGPAREELLAKVERAASNALAKVRRARQQDGRRSPSPRQRYLAEVTREAREERGQVPPHPDDSLPL